MEAVGGAALIMAGRLWVDDAEIIGTERGRPAVFRSPERFRPYVLVRGGGRAVIRNSRLLHLGYAASHSYGLSFSAHEAAGSLAPPGGIIAHSQMIDLWYGFYSWGAADVVLLDNRFRANIRYGIDPHDGSRHLVIARNRVWGTRRGHGIILSRRVTGSVIVGNAVSDNRGSGIVLDRKSHRNRVDGNRVWRNGGDGIVLYESDGVQVTRNRVEGNRGVGIRIRNGRREILSGNRVMRNGGGGVRIYTGRVAKVAAEFGADFVERSSLLLEGGVLAANRTADLVVKGPGIEWLRIAATARIGRVGGDRRWRRALSATGDARDLLLVDGAPVPPFELRRLLSPEP